MKRFRLLSILVLVLLASACSDQYLMKKMTVGEKMAQGNQYYERGKFERAKTYYREVVFEKNASYTPEAQMKLAESHYNLEEWADAIDEFEVLIKQYPDHPGIETAYLRIAWAWWNQSEPPQYDQAETQYSIEACNEFLERFPFSDKREEVLDLLHKGYYKLLEKTYYNGYIYYKMWDYPAAMLYFDEVIDKGNTDELDKMSLYYAGKIHLYRKDLEGAQRYVGRLVERYPDSDEAGELADDLEDLKP